MPWRAIAYQERLPQRVTIGRHENQEVSMTERDAQDDHVGSQYDAYARTATLKQVERYTFFRMARALDG